MPPLNAVGCPRGATHHDLKAEPPAIHVRHCTKCKKQVLSAFWILVILFRDYVTVTKGSSKVFSRPASDEHSIECT